MKKKLWDYVVCAMLACLFVQKIANQGVDSLWIFPPGARAVLMAGTIGLSMIVFSPAYFLIDGGITYSTAAKAKRSGRPGEVRTVGGWFNDYLRGYVGLSVVLSYFLFVYRYVMAIEMELIFVLFWLGLPFFVTVSTIPTFIYLDKRKKTRIRYIRGIAERRGISSEAKNIN